MKEFLSKMFWGFAYGIGFGISIAAIVYISDWIKEDKKPKFPSHKIVKNPEGVEILSSRLLATSEYVFIAATVVNKSDRLWEGVKIQADLYDNEGYLTTCEEHNDIGSDETINIDLVCFKMRSDMMPKDTTYKVFVATARDKI